MYDQCVSSSVATFYRSCSWSRCISGSRYYSSIVTTGRLNRKLNLESHLTLALIDLVYKYNAPLFCFNQTFYIAPSEYKIRYF